MAQVVISGIAGQFPRGKNFEEFGRSVLANEYLVSQSQRWSAESQGVPSWVGETQFKEFDHAYFGISRPIALYYDPTSRASHERALEAIIDAGCNPASLRGSNTMVFSGSVESDFNSRAFQNLHRGFKGHWIMGMNQAMVCNRLSYLLDLKGTSLCLGGSSACMHQCFKMATESIQRGACDAAILIVSSAVAYPNLSREHRNLGLLSEDGLTKSFDQHGRGSARSDCSVAFFLQREDLAKRCYAWVMGGGAGRVCPGPEQRFDMTQPSPAGLETFLQDLYRDSGVDPGNVAYVEADGCGQPVRDAVELTVLDRVFGENRRDHEPLAVSSAKSNVANTENAAGAVSVCRAVVAMEAGTIPASLHCGEPIRVQRDGGESGVVQVATRNAPLHLHGDRGAVAVNTLGVAGEVGHLILRPNLREKQRVDPASELPRLVPLCGRTAESTLRTVEKLKSYAFDPEYLRLVQDTYGLGIRGFEFRTFVVCPPQPDEPVVVSKVEPHALWFVYSGMGSQWVGMGRGLMDLPVFGDTIRRLHAILEPKGVNLMSIMTATSTDVFEDILRSFVGITGFQIALTNVMKVVGLQPDGIIGHSLGEVACAYADGCLTEEQAILAAWARGMASNEAKLIKGMMAAVGLGYSALCSRLPPSIEVACRNSSSSCTLSGPAEDVRSFVEELERDGVFVRAVNVSDIAYHSSYVRPAAAYLRQHMRGLIPAPRRRSARWLSTSVAEGQRDTHDALHCSEEYLVNNLLSPVLFEDALHHVPAQAVVVELAPRGLMQAILRRALPDNHNIALSSRTTKEPLRTLLAGIGGLYSCGFHPLVSALYPEMQFPVSRGTPPLSPLVQWHHEDSVSYTIVAPTESGFVTRTLQVDSPHMTLEGLPLYALSEMLEMVWKSLATISQSRMDSMSVIFDKIHVCSYETVISSTQAEVAVSASVHIGTGRFEVASMGSSEVTGRVLVWGRIQQPEKNNNRQMKEKRTAPGKLPGAEYLDGEEVLHDLATRGLRYSDKYCGTLAAIETGDQEWLLRLRKPRSVARLLEAALQAAVLRNAESNGTVALVRTVQRLEVDASRLLGTDLELRYHLPTGLIQGPGLFLSGVTMFEKRPLLPAPSSYQPQLPMHYQFVPFGATSLQSETEFVSLAVQLAVETVESAPEGDGFIIILEPQGSSLPDYLMPSALQAAAIQLGLQIEVQTMAVEAAPEAILPACLIVCGPDENGTAAGARMVAHSGGVLLAWRLGRPSPPSRVLRALAEQRFGAHWLSVQCQAVPLPEHTHVVTLAAGEKPPARLHSKDPAVLVWRGQPAGGVSRAVQDVQRARRYGGHCRLVFLLDTDAAPFCPGAPLYARQLQLRRPVSVLRGGLWGCWRALPLSRGPARPRLELTSALTPSRLGDVQVSALGLNALEKQDKLMWCGDMDYVCSLSPAAGREMGLAAWPPVCCQPVADPLLRWRVPAGWTDTEAATVPYAYATAYYALCVLMQLEEGESIFITGAASAVGQAAVRVALQHRCRPLLLAVCSEAERQLVARLFPQVERRHVLLCTPSAWMVHVRQAVRGLRCGARLALNTLPGTEALAATMDCCANKYGRIAHLGRRDMLAGGRLRSAWLQNQGSVFGLSGQHLWRAGPEQRGAVLRAVQRGLDCGVVQPLVGVRELQGEHVAGSPGDTRWLCNAEAEGCVKVVLRVDRGDGGLSRVELCRPDRSYGILGGSQAEWLQVADWLLRHGARHVLAAPTTPRPADKDNPGREASLLRHRQRCFRQQFGVEVRVEEVLGWDEAAVERVIGAAMSSAPLDAVIVILEAAPPSSACRVPLLVDSAMRRLTSHRAGAEATAVASLLVLMEGCDAASELHALSEARRGTELRVAGLCYSGSGGGLPAALRHLGAMLRGALPPLTLLPGSDSGSASIGGAGFQPRLAPPLPGSAAALAQLGRGLASLPSRGVRLRRLRCTPPRESLPLFVLPPMGVLDCTAKTALSALASHVVSPILCVEHRPDADVSRRASTLAQVLLELHPTGPFTLFSWGLGTPVALEVSRLLEARGHNAVTFLLDGDVLAVRDWASSVKDLDIMRMAFAEEDGVLSVLEAQNKQAEWAELLPLVLAALSPDSRAPAAMVTGALQAVRAALRSLSHHDPRPAVERPVSWRLICVRTAAFDTSCFATSDDRVERLLMPPQEVLLGLRGGWLAAKINAHCAWPRLASQEEVKKLLLRR